jgi:ring-1,2-phenylacetyl-CoA epoxidase subunit PaaC
MHTEQALFRYLLQLGDTNLILGHRLSEMCSRGPMLEEDIALTNIALDHIGQAEALLHFAGQVEGEGRTEDDLTYRRNEKDFLHFRLVEQPNTDFAYVITRQFLVDVYQCLLYQRLQHCHNDTLAGMAKRFLKEVTYHQRHSAEWIVRLGLGTTESHTRIQQAFHDLWKYTGEMFVDTAQHTALSEKLLIPLAADLEMDWQVQVVRVTSSANVHLPATQPVWQQTTQTEHLSHLLAEMQYLPRTYPDASW